MAEWTPELTLNHELLDAQHVELFRILASADKAFDGPPAAVRAAVSAFADALVTHFAAEESIMEDALYPERSRHRSAHELFMADFLKMREELDVHGPSSAVAEWMRRRIPDWLRFHIQVNDLPLGAYLARRTQRTPLEASTVRDRRRRQS